MKKGGKHWARHLRRKAAPRVDPPELTGIAALIPGLWQQQITRVVSPDDILHLITRA